MRVRGASPALATIPPLALSSQAGRHLLPARILNSWRPSSRERGPTSPSFMKSFRQSCLSAANQLPFILALLFYLPFFLLRHSGGGERVDFPFRTLSRCSSKCTFFPVFAFTFTCTELAFLSPAAVLLASCVQSAPHTSRKS